MLDSWGGATRSLSVRVFGGGQVEMPSRFLPFRYLLPRGCGSDAAARTLHKRGAQGVAREDTKNPKSKIGICASENVGEQKKPALSAP